MTTQNSQQPTEQKELQQPTELTVQFEKVELELITHVAERQGLTVAAIVRELAIDELRDRIKNGRLPVTEDFPAHLKQTAQILGATQTDLAHNMMHEPNRQKTDIPNE
ncbi:hypothetical protein [Deinococcus cellulosilyticus]|uniref:Uncharacterized protein n=1 Tax=Deinococcus cellulosilyticus (strain DSM 18568 / NBRC 106333 / KACC 11606 / 5516J-15) TaxID=1223518 RepID=A0A511MYN8_DEIC1|nr:hypothetical protein [Deinococcus cellulosilyticus]GEM45710.1 hypothetical protein DC3_13450 [Deinococcus cellulosilyticus NBRC 106333 = KACC 11606]